MSKEQIIYLVFFFLSCVVYGTFAATYTHYEISPIYDSDGTIITKEKWLAKRAKKED